MGNAKCICTVSPETFRLNCERMYLTPEASNMNLLLDHRCPHHGEKAQPKLWGRHKELELAVPWADWASLGIEPEEGWKKIDFSDPNLPKAGSIIQVRIVPNTLLEEWLWKPLG
jgi:hypothetical protein